MLKDNNFVYPETSQWVMNYTGIPLNILLEEEKCEPFNESKAEALDFLIAEAELELKN